MHAGMATAKYEYVIQMTSACLVPMSASGVADDSTDFMEVSAQDQVQNIFAIPATPMNSTRCMVTMLLMREQCHCRELSEA